MFSDLENNNLCTVLTHTKYKTHVMQALFFIAVFAGIIVKIFS